MVWCGGGGSGGGSGGGWLYQKKKNSVPIFFAENSPVFGKIFYCRYIADIKKPP